MELEKEFEKEKREGKEKERQGFLESVLLFWTSGQGAAPDPARGGPPDPPQLTGHGNKGRWTEVRYITT